MGFYLGLISGTSTDAIGAALLEYTAATIGAAVRQCAPRASLYVCGGGAHNPNMLSVLPSSAAGVTGAAGARVLGGIYLKG